jgi:uncharacterized protein
MKHTGIADLPLHGGHVPEWLSVRMTQLGREIVRAVIEEHGHSALLARLSDPFWFQALGCVMGMDWHSSGITTTVMGALKRALNPIFNDVGIYVCGGRGKYALQTPAELLALSNRTGLAGNELVRASKLSAKVDNNCIADGFTIYLHSFVVSKTGEWAVVQQGMNTETGMARRYHWHSANIASFVDDPHTAVIGSNLGTILNLSDKRASDNRQGIVDFTGLNPDTQMQEMRKLVMDRDHRVKPKHVDAKRLGAVLTLAHEQQYKTFVDVLLHPGVGPRTVQSLALVSEVIYGAPGRFSDPARFAFAHGGKDGHPFPVPLTVYDETITMLRRAVDRAKIGNSDKLSGIRTLSRMSKLIEQNLDPFADVDRVINHERRNSYKYNGMTVFGPAKKPKDELLKPPDGIQTSLFD